MGLSKLNYGLIFTRILSRFFKRMERKILRTCIRRKYLDPWNTRVQMEPLIPFPLILDDDSLTPDPKDHDVSFCSLCDFEVDISVYVLLFCSMMFKHELCIVTLRKRHYTYGGSIQMSKSCGMNLYSDKKGFKFLYISQVNRYSKHCRTCNRCVEGFDHHCRVRDNIFLSFFLLCTIIGMVGYS